MSRSAIETILGAVVLLVAATFIIFAFSTTDLRAVDGYTVHANFSQTGGLVIGSDVRISGVRIGSISDMSLDSETYLAKVTMSIDPSIKLPEDTVAKISSEGLLGGNYMALEPGGAMDYLKPGDQIQYTQASVSLEEMIGKLMFSMSSDEKPETENKQEK